MDKPLPPLARGGSKAKELQQRRPSLLASTGSKCHICQKGASDSCSTCSSKTCIGCLQADNVCSSCITLTGARQAYKPVSKYASIFPSKRRPSGDTSTPDRRGSMEGPSPGLGGKFFSMFRRGSSSSSRNLMATLEKERHASPLAKQMHAVAVQTLDGPSSDELAGKLEREVTKFKNLTERLEQENAELRQQLESRTTGNASEAAHATDGATQLAGSGTELAEAKARVVDLQVQVQEARDEVVRIKAELGSARDKERQLEEYVQEVLARQQGGQAAASNCEVGPNGHRRSAVPPCVPFPNTAESHVWLESIRNGSYVDYWKTAAASEAALPGALPPPPVANFSANGKRRSEIPAPPPLPAGMAPKASAVFASMPGQGRRSSAPSLLETVPHQKKREALFAAASQGKTELKPLFWTVFDQTKVQGTIFEKITTDKPPVKPEDLNPQLKALMARFAKRANKGGALQAQAQQQNAPEKVPAPRLQIMDAKRRQQIGIGLGAFRNVSLLELKKAIIALDPHILFPDRVKNLLEMIPTQEEITQLDGFRAGGQLDQSFFEGMTKEETFFVDMASIPRLRQRLMCFLMEASFDSSREQLVEDLDTFSDAIKTVRESVQWKAFLALLLETGNFLNDGNQGLGGAWGFSLKEGLKRFVDMKSCENNSRFSLMHWVAEVAAAHKPELFSLQDQFGPVSDASARSVEELKAEVNSIKRQLDIVKGEVDKSKMESSESASKFLSRMVPFLEQVLLVEYAKMQQKLEDIEKAASQLVTMHGESPTQTTCQQLFVIILEGVSAFLKCHEDNISAKLAEQKQQLQSAVKASKAVPDGATGAKVTPVKRDQNNRIMRDTGVATGPAKQELEMAMSKIRKQQPNAAN